jgi:hypothetical protein
MNKIFIPLFPIISLTEFNKLFFKLLSLNRYFSKTINKYTYKKLISLRISYFVVLMSVIFKIPFILTGLLILSGSSLVWAQTLDSTLIQEMAPEKYNQFYDSLQYKAQKNKLTRLFYDFLITQKQPSGDKKSTVLNYFKIMEGKTISGIDITPLEVFGPVPEDTTKKAKSWIERAANDIHTKSNLHTIEKLLMFKTGDTIQPEMLYENERIIRSLPYIKDVRFFLEPDSLNDNAVKVHVITKDRFSLGVSGGVSGTSSADFEVYNQNIFGVGHEVSFRFVGHLKRQPYTGLETFYKINNIQGKFINISAGYMNTFQKEGFAFILDKPFITTSIKWGYGASASRMFRTDRILEDTPLKIPETLSYSYISGWGGKSFQIKPNNYHNSQVVLTAGIYNRTFYRRPAPAPSQNQYFSNNTFYLAGVTFTQRRFVQDQLVYSYGITEDIPEGFKNEIVYGYDANEFGDRHYMHLYLSNGNLLPNRDGYFYLSGGVGGYFRDSYFEQGQVQGSLSFISRQINAGKKRFRLFVKSNYMLGIRRFEIETLDLAKKEDIRGFAGGEALGKQKLSVDLEYVLFLRREFYRFNMAFFGFADVGIIGSNKKVIFSQNYYSGLGLGLRLHNESLVFKTLQLRLAFYPFPPDDMSFVGFILNEQLKKSFYSFEPTAPQPLRFE